MRQPMNATAEEIDRWLATEVMGWQTHLGWYYVDQLYPKEGHGGLQRINEWKPTNDRNQLSRVLANVPEESRESIVVGIQKEVGWVCGRWFFLTADPLTVATAIYQDLREQQTV